MQRGNPSSPSRSGWAKAAAAPAPARKSGSLHGAVQIHIDQAPEKGADLDTLRPLRRAQDGGNEATVGVEDDDRLEAVFVIGRTFVLRTRMAANAWGRRPFRVSRSERRR
jgi:hypothetical protein